MDNSSECSQFIDRFAFLKIFNTFRIAIHPSKIIIAFLAVAVICLAGWIMDFNKTVIVADGTNELAIYLNNPDELASYIEYNKDYGEQIGVFSTLWTHSAFKFQGAIDSLFVANFLGFIDNITGYFTAVGWALKYHFVYSIIFFIIKLVVICIAGGAICRITALQFARGEKPGLTEALKYSMQKFISFLSAPLAPIGISIFLGLCILLPGLLGNIPRVGELVVALFFGFSLIAGTLITIVFIGTIGGFNLMFPAVAYDNSDCFDAISRSYSYVYSKPWHMGFYTIVAAIYGAICYMFVRFFVFLLLLITHWFLKMSIFVENAESVDKLVAVWPKPEFISLTGSASLATANWAESVAAFVINLYVLTVIGLLVAFVVSFYFSANTIIYSLMRKKVDNTPCDEIYIPTEQEKTELAENDTTQKKPEKEDD